MKATSCTCHRRCPGLSAGKASQLLQQTDRLIKTVPEVERVFGKMGRAETATDPAPLEMFETTIRFKPRDQWRTGMTPEKLIEELDRALQLPGLANVWVPPIRNRIDMLATGIKSPVGVKVAGPIPSSSTRSRSKSSARCADVPGVSSALAERLAGGRYIEVDIDREAAVALWAQHCRRAERHQRRHRWRDHRRNRRGAAALSHQRALSARAARFADRSAPACPSSPSRARRSRWAPSRISRIADGPPMLRSENARLSGWVYVDLRGRDLRSAVDEMRERVTREVQLPAGYSISWSGQFEYLERAQRQAARRGAVHVARDLRAAVSHFPALRRGAAHHGDTALLADRRILVHLSSGARMSPLRRRSASSRSRAWRRNSAS